MDLQDYFQSKVTVRAGAVLCAFVLICGGMYMCFSGLNAKGSIDVKAAVIEGHIETGSLGLFAMFLGVVIVLALIFSKHRPYEGQEIKLVVNGNEITGKGLSYRKMRELVQVANSESPNARGVPRT
jgi:hypothetical protein